MVTLLPKVVRLSASGMAIDSIPPEISNIVPKAGIKGRDAITCWVPFWHNTLQIICMHFHHAPINTPCYARSENTNTQRITCISSVFILLGQCSRYIEVSKFAVLGFYHTFKYFCHKFGCRFWPQVLIYTHGYDQEYCRFEHHLNIFVISMYFH